MTGMHQKSMSFPVLWRSCFHQQLMPLKGYSPPGNNLDWPQTLLFLSCWPSVVPKKHQVVTSVEWSAILRSYFLKIMVYRLHQVDKHARGTTLCGTAYNSVWPQNGSWTVLIYESSSLEEHLVIHLANSRQGYDTECLMSKWYTIL